MPRLKPMWELRRAGHCPHVPSATPPTCWITARSDDHQHCGGHPSRCLAERWYACSATTHPDDSPNKWPLDAFIEHQARKSALFDAAELREKSLTRICASWPPPVVNESVQVCAWLRKAVTYAAMDLVRQEVRRCRHYSEADGDGPAILIEALPDSRPGPDHCLVELDQLQTLQRALARLQQQEPQLRAIIDLVYGQDYSIQQAAQILGVSRNTPRNLLNRALPLLRTWIESGSDQ